MEIACKTYSQLNVDYFNGKVPLLFNVYEDPSEKYDRADKHPKIVKELTLLLNSKLEEVKATGSLYD